MQQLQRLLHDRHLLDAILLGGVSIVLFQLGFTAVAFLVPLEVSALRGIAGRTGLRSLFVSATVVAIGLIVVTVVRSFGISDGDLGAVAGEGAFSAQQVAEASRALAVANLAMPAGLIGGLIVYHLPRLAGMRRLYRLIIGGIVAAVGALPTVLQLVGDGPLAQVLNAQIAAVLTMVGTGAEAGGAEIALIRETSGRIIERLFAFSLFLVLVGNWYFATVLEARRSIVRGVLPTGDLLPPVSVRFKLPSWGIWVLLVSWAGVLVTIVAPATEVFAPIVWNVALIALLLYGLVGLGIVRSLLARSSTHPLLRRLASIGLLVLLFVPRVNTIVLIGLPLLGASELWITYRPELRGQEPPDGDHQGGTE